MRTSSPCFGIPSYTLAALGAVALFGTTAQAADLGPQPLPPLTVPVDTWTGLSFGIGGGIGIFNASVDTFAKRKDTIEQCTVIDEINSVIVCDVPWELNETFRNFQDSSINDLGDEGGFGTIQAAYDLQVGSNWVLGAFVDADLYGGMDANAKQFSKSRNDFFQIPIGDPGNLVDFGANSTLTSKTEIGLDWSISVGGRIGWLATPSTLLYFLAAYTHAELDKARLNVSSQTVFSTSEDIDELGGGCLVFGGCPLALTVNLPKSLDGYTLGGGGEVKLGGPGSHWSLRGEYRFTRLDGEKARFDKDSAQAFATAFNETVGLRRNAFAKAGIEIDDIDIHTVRAMLAYRF